MHEQYKPNPENQPQREGGTDYAAMLSSIRADQDRETFVADLRRNKEQLLSMADYLMHNRGLPPEDRRICIVVGGYLDIVLKQHVFDIDPFVSSKRPDDEQLYEDRQVICNWLLQNVGSAWLEQHPDSEAARAIARLGIFAFPWDHKELLQEMWPSLRVVAIHSVQSRKKVDLD